jgi:hypothetical protein
MHDERLSLSPPIGERLFGQFVAVAGEETDASPSPGWSDALAVARLVLRLKG